jgi:hypothetical protein
MPGVETKDFESEIAKPMRQPWRHRSSLDPYADVISHMPTHYTMDLFWNCEALVPP